MVNMKSWFSLLWHKQMSTFIASEIEMLTSAQTLLPKEFSNYHCSAIVMNVQCIALQKYSIFIDPHSMWWSVQSAQFRKTQQDYMHTDMCIKAAHACDFVYCTHFRNQRCFPDHQQKNLFLLLTARWHQGQTNLFVTFALSRDDYDLLVRLKVRHS